LAQIKKIHINVRYNPRDNLYFSSNFNMYDAYFSMIFFGLKGLYV